MDYSKHYFTLVNDFIEEYGLGSDSMGEDSIFRVTYENQVPISLGIYEAHALFIKIDLGKPKAEDMQEIYRLALKANWFGEDIDGARICLSPEREVLALIDVRAMESIEDHHQLGEWFAEIGRVAVKWHKRLQGDVSALDAVDAPEAAQEETQAEAKQEEESVQVSFPPMTFA